MMMYLYIIAHYTFHLVSVFRVFSIVCFFLHTVYSPVFCTDNLQISLQQPVFLHILPTFYGRIITGTTKRGTCPKTSA